MTPAYEARIARVLESIEDARTPQPVDELAALAGLSRYHFHRVFRAAVGESVMGYQRRVALVRAARALRQRPARAIVDVALEAGYQSHEAFTRAFKSTFKKNPRDFRDEDHHRALTFGPTREVELREVDAIPVGMLKHIGPWDNIGVAWGEMFARAQQAMPAQTYGRYYDDPEVVPPARLRADLCFHLEDERDLPAGFVSGVIASGLYAVIVHEGSYATLHESYLELVGRFVPTTAHELDDAPCVERYLNLPHEVSEAELRTEIWAPLISDPL